MTHQSKACCTLPPVVADDYTPKGSYKTINGVKTYVTGSASADKGVYWIYDIFGYSPPTVQGADIVAAAGYLVAIPDVLDSTFAEMKWFMDPGNEDNQKAQGKFMGYVQDLPQHLKRVDSSLNGLKSEYKSVQKWAGFGFCFGSKVVAVTSGADTPWSVGVHTSPAFVDPKDAAKITIPQMMLASKDESVDDVKAFEANLKVTKHIETFSTMPHGWMSARGDFKDSKAKAEYERGYQLAVDFIGAHL